MYRVKKKMCTYDEKNIRQIDLLRNIDKLRCSGFIEP